MRNARRAPACLFVYGSLRRGSGHPMARMLAHKARYLGPASLRARLYRIATYCGVKLSARVDEQVRGDLYCLPVSPTLLRRLDDYEDHRSHQPTRGEFLRIAAEVSRLRGDPRPAWVYAYNREVPETQRIATGDFLAGRHPVSISVSVPLGRCAPLN